MSTTTTGSWREAPNLVALDLEGSGAQDGDDEAILEIAAVRLIHGRPDVDTAYSTLINPGRRIPPRSWISPGLTDVVLAGAPGLEQIQTQLAQLLDGVYLVGHNIRVDWRLLHRHCPDITIAGLIDTYRLSRTLPIPGKRNLTALLDRYQLTTTISAAAPRSQPHRALWDTIGAAVLLDTLVQQRWQRDPDLTELLAAAAPPQTPPAEPPAPAPATLFD